MKEESYSGVPKTPIPERTPSTIAGMTVDEMPTPVPVNIVAKTEQQKAAALAETRKIMLDGPQGVGSTGVPEMPKIIDLGIVKFNTGVYIMTSDTASGKSVTSTALVAWVNASKKYSASYIYHFEPRARPLVVDAVRKDKLFEKAKSYISDIDRLFEKRMKIMEEDTPPILVALDSCTLPLKAHASFYPGQATFEKGMQISDREFLDILSRIAVICHACMIVVLNESLVPYVAELYGASEGHIKILDLETITVADRSGESKRMDREVRIPKEFVDLATRAWRLGAYDAEKANRSRRTIIGV